MQIPLIGVVSLEFKVRVGVFVGLLHHRVFKVVTFAQRAVAVIVVIHPLVDRRSLLAHGFQCWMRMQQRKRGGQAVVGDSVHSHFAAVVGDVFHQPLDAVVGVGRFVGGFGVA